MGKPMYTEHGFTLIEMMLVLSLITSMSLLVMMQRPVTISTQDEIIAISQTFDQARMYALTHKETVKIAVTKHQINLSSAHYQQTYRLHKPYAFTNSHSFSYNSSGHIKIAKTLKLKTPDGSKSFVFQLGSGAYYVQ